MKYLSIVRHAQAKHAEHTQRDIDRTLTDRGLIEAELTANLVADIIPQADYVICSAAQRTRQTAMVLQEQINKRPNAIWPSPIWSERAYLADTETLRTLLKNASPSAEHVVLIGHNPGVEELVFRLGKTNVGHINLFMATGTLAHLKLNISEWKDLEWGCGELIKLAHP